jgi:hypothetical protein
MKVIFLSYMSELKCCRDVMTVLSFQWILKMGMEALNEQRKESRDELVCIAD